MPRWYDDLLVEEDGLPRPELPPARWTCNRNFAKSNGDVIQDAAAPAVALANTVYVNGKTGKGGDADVGELLVIVVSSLFK